jgi:hemophore-related protein
VGTIDFRPREEHLVHIRSLLAGVGVATAVGAGALVAVTTASADPGSGTTTASSSPSSSSCPRADVRKEVADYLNAHPDVKQELQKIRSLPKDQRAAERKTYLAAHPDVKQQLQTFRADRRGAWWETVGNESAILQAHPDLADLFKAVGAAPAGQRQATAQAYLKQHPDVGKELQQVRQEHRQACHPGK